MFAFLMPWSYTLGVRGKSNETDSDVTYFKSCNQVKITIND